MIGARVGARIGARVGTAIGTGADPIAGGGANPMAGVTQDAASGKYFPATLTEWQTTLSVAGASGDPSAAHLMQDAAGPIADALGTLTLTVTGAPTFQAAVTGYTRKKISNGVGDGNTMRLDTANAALPDISTTSFLALVVADMPTAAPGATRNMIEMGTNATRAACEFFVTGGTNLARSVANTQAGAADPKSAVHLMWLQVDRTNSTVKVFTDQEVVTVTFGGTMAGKNYSLFAVSGGQAAASMGYLYDTLFYGAAAEKTQAQIKAISQTLGWTIPW